MGSIPARTLLLEQRPNGLLPELTGLKNQKPLGARGGLGDPKLVPTHPLPHPSTQTVPLMEQDDDAFRHPGRNASQAFPWLSFGFCYDDSSYVFDHGCRRIFNEGDAAEASD